MNPHTYGNDRDILDILNDPDLLTMLSPQILKQAADEIKQLREALTGEKSVLEAWKSDTLIILKERDEVRREVCFLLSRNVTQGCDGDTPEFHATARGWCYLLEEDDE
jgi:hypothetical protein